jgi:hypothetical protein
MFAAAPGGYLQASRRFKVRCQSSGPWTDRSSYEFQDVSLNQWLRRVPSKMLKAHLNIDKAEAMKIPAENLAVIQGLLSITGRVRSAYY